MSSARITEVVTSWPGVVAVTGARGEWSFRHGDDEIGHLHGDRVAHFGFPRDLGARLREEGRVGPHPVNRHSPRLAAREVATDDDVQDVIAIMRLNYERLAVAGD